MSEPSASDPEGRPVVVIDCLPESARRYREGWAVVAVDVIRATTTAVTAVVTGRRCYPVPTVPAAIRRGARLRDPLLAGEIGGVRPEGFDMTNSPAEMASRTDLQRPVVLVSSSGTRLMANTSRTSHGYVACLRNARSTARHLAGRYRKVAVLGAGSRGRFREEDQACCARIAADLVDRGFDAGDERTGRLIDRWSDAPPEAWLDSASVRYLRSTGQERDLDFILSHRDDLDLVVGIRHGMLRVTRPSVVFEERLPRPWAFSPRPASPSGLRPDRGSC